MENQKYKDLSACAHVHVERFQIEKDGRVFEEQWRCKDCGVKFVALDGLFGFPGKITVMDPVKTLRDEFAMAAMIADAVQGGIVAAGHIGKGLRIVTDIMPTLADGAKEYYEIADAMLEARK